MSKDLFVIREGTQSMYSSESRFWDIDVSAWTSSPTSPTCKLYDISTETDVSSTRLSGVASIVGGKVRTQVVSGVTADKTYRMECSFTGDGQTWTACIFILVYGAIKP